MDFKINEYIFFYHTTLFYVLRQRILSFIQSDSDIYYLTIKNMYIILALLKIIL